MADETAALVEASWSIELNCECPECREYVDLLSDAEFWDGRNLDIGEHDTPRADNLPVCCPECGHVFEVKCVY